MPKRRLYRMFFFLFHFMLLSMGCDVAENQWNNLTNSGSGSSSGSSSGTKTSSQELPAHGQETVNLLARSPFKGRDLDPAFWTNMEAYCKAGPTQLIIGDMTLIPPRMEQAGFSGPVNQLYYALASTYAGFNWAPEDATSQVLSDNRSQIDAWWARYVQAVIQIMQKAPQTTAVVIVNDGPDRLGSRLGNETYKNMAAVRDRVRLGEVIP
jgi:hypothetical protein